MTAELRDSNENSENQTLVACICTACSCRMRNGEKMDEDKWSSFGFRPGTGAFANCMMEQSAHVEDDNRRWGAKRRAQEERDRERKKSVGAVLKARLMTDYILAAPKPEL